MQQGRHAAENIMRFLAGRPRRPFRYVDKGMLATIGRGAAVAHVGRAQISGFLAWLFWLFVHIVFLIGFLPTWLMMRARTWSHRRRVEALERQRASSTPETISADEEASAV